jgi:hypothetical protein
MSWGMVAGAVIGGVVSYAGQKSSNKANAKLAKGAGDVNTTTTRTPAPGMDPYLDAGRQAAYDTLFGTSTAPAAVRGDPNAPTKPVAKPGVGRFNKAGVWVPAAAGSTASAGAPATTATGAPAPFKGQSPETADIIGRLSKLDQNNAGLYGAGEKYVTSSLAGDATNPLIGRAETASNAIAEDPRLAAYQDALMADLGIGGPAGGGRAGGLTGAAAALAAPRTVIQGGHDPSSSASRTGVDVALRKLIAGEAPQGWTAAEDAISRKVNEGRAANIRELRARSVGSGFYGGDLYKQLEEGAIAQGDQELADSLGAARYKAFSDALGLGTQYDLGMANIAAGDRASSASAGAAAAELASREKLAKYGYLGDMLGLGEQGRFGKASTLGDLAGLVSGDQRSALGGVTDIGAARRGDLGAAGQLALGSDEARNSYLAARGSESVGRGNIGLGRAELAFDREKFYDPFARLSSYTSILGNLYGPYGSETTQGRDTRSSSPPAYASPAGAALTGAAIGGQMAGAYQSRSRPVYSGQTSGPVNWNASYVGG